MNKYLLFILYFLISGFHSEAQSPDKEKITGLFENQLFEEAIDYLNPFYLTDSNNLQLLNFLGYANYMNDNKEKAAVYFQKTLIRDSNNISANQYLGSIHIADNHPGAAVIFFQRLIHLVPDRSSYYRILGNIFSKIQEKDSALFYYNRAYQLAPYDNKNITAYTENLLNDSNYVRADSILRTGLEKDPMNISYLKLLILSSYDSKNYQAAISPGEKLIDLGELSVKIIPKLALSYYMLSRYKDCIRVCEILDSNNLAGESIYYYEASSWSKLNNPRLSNKLLEKCLDYSISKTSELYYFNIAQNCESLKAYKQAIASYDTAYYLFKSPGMLYSAGRMYDAQKNYSKAKTYYLKYLRLAHPLTKDDRRLYQYVKNRCKSLK